LNIKKLWGGRERKKEKKKNPETDVQFMGVKTSGWGWKYVAGGSKYMAGVQKNGSEARRVAEEG
jgi:hypothetical protein